MTHFGAVLLLVFGSDAFFGFIGGVGYAGTRLATALWGGAEIDHRARKLAVAQFVLALILAPAAGHVGAPVIVAMWPNMKPPAAALLVGILFNAVWPLVTERAFLRKLIADVAAGIAARMTPGASQ